MRHFALSAVLSAFAIVGAHAADVPLLEPTETVDTSFVGSPIYVQLLGGATLGLDATFYIGDVVNVPDPTRIGYAVAGAVGVTVMDGFSVEADVLHTFRNEVAAGLDTYATTSLMLNGKFTAPIGDRFSLYGAVGVGYIWVNNFDGPPVNTNFTLDGWGYQLIAGGGVQITEHVTGIAEFRYQDTFQRYAIGAGPASLHLPTASILGGILVDF